MLEYVKKFAREGAFELSEEIAEAIIAESDEIRLNSNEKLISCGDKDPDVYIVSEGILKVCYLSDNKKEVTIGFTSIGTVLLSPFGYRCQDPAFMYIVACNKCAVRRIAKDKFDAFISSSHEFAKWMYSVAIHQFHTSERRLQLFSGTAQERYVALIRNRPDIIRNVSMKDIASYLGVTPSYLCKLKRRLLYE